VTNISGLGTGFSSGKLLKKVLINLFRLALSYPYKIFFQNEDDRREFIRLGIVHLEKTDRLPGSGVDLKRFTPAIRMRRNELIFLMVARLLWEKGVGIYVDAARLIKKKYPGTVFNLLGFLNVQNPSAVQKCDIESWEKEGVVKYLGSTDNVLQYYNESDCVVLPSFYREGVPRSLLEAASMELPIITTDHIGCRDVVEHGKNGFLCKMKDAQDLAEIMEMMILLTPEQREKMGREGRAKMEREFDERIVIEKYLSVVKEIENLNK
jgi:glycosyltransferase involved in cell wall biosynthesis